MSKSKDPLDASIPQTIALKEEIRMFLIRVLLVFCIGLLGMLVRVQADERTPVEKKVQGTWKIQSLEADGDPAPGEIISTLKWKFQDKSLTMIPGEPGFTQYTFKMDDSKKPGQFEMTPVGGKDKGKPQKGIFKMDGELLTICFSLDKGFPIKFTSKDNNALYILKRLKD